MIIGGVAVIAHGVPRLTVDIDATVAAAETDLDQLITVLTGDGIQARIENAREFAERNQIFLAVHDASGTSIDLSLAWLPFEEQALRVSQPCVYAGVNIRIPSPEDLVVYKLVAARPLDLADAEGLMVLHGESMNLARIRMVVGEFAALLDDEERPRLLDRLIAKTGLER
jgi:uncharacterized nucleotidyltransferase DUF6036